MKRIISFALGLALLMSGFQAPLAQASFSDVDSSNPYAPAIQWMARNQAIDGYENGEFAPQACMSRAEFLVMLYRVMEVDVYSAHERELPYTDVKEGKWYRNVVETAYERGTMEGYSDETFRPSKCMRRAEAIKVAALEFNEGELPTYISNDFADDLGRDLWYGDYVDYALSTSQVGTDHVLVSEDDFVFFLPEGYVSREEVSEMLYRMKAVSDHGELSYTEWIKPFPLEKELFFNRCEARAYDKYKALGVETLIPTHADLVVGLDQTNARQADALWTLVDRFAGTAWEDVVTDYNQLDLPNSLKWDAAIQPVLDGEWELAMALVVPKGMEESVLELDEDDMEIYVIGSFEEYKTVENALGRQLQMEYEGEVTCERENGFIYWTVESEDLYIVHGEGMFVLTNSAENRERAVSRADSAEEFKQFKGAKSAYVYANEETSAALAEEFGTSLAGIGDLAMSLGVSDEGLLLSSWADLELNSDFADFYEKEELTLAERVNGEGLFAYLEGSLLGDMVDLQLAPMEMLLSETLGLEDNELLNGDFALAVQEGEGMIPAVSFYLETEDEDSVLYELVDTFIENQLLWWELDMVLMEDVQEGLTGWRVEFPGQNEEMDVYEFYYGQADDDTFVLAIQNDLMAGYGEEVVAENEDFMAALDQLSNHSGNVSYVNSPAIVDWAWELYLEPEMENMMGEEDASIILEALDALGVMVSSNWMEDDRVYSEFFVGVR